MGFQSIHYCKLNELASELVSIENTNCLFISFCHESDLIQRDAAIKTLEWINKDHDASIYTSDESVAWNIENKSFCKNYQLRTAPSPFRIITRGYIGGLISLKIETLKQLKIPRNPKSAYSFFIEIFMQIITQDLKISHCPETLIQRSISKNPNIPEVASPADRLNFKDEIHSYTYEILQRYRKSLLRSHSYISSHPKINGCFAVHYASQKETLVSILIPLKDKLQLTRKCVESIQRHAGKIQYEIILIDNGSEEDATKSWLEEQNNKKHINTIRINRPFNYSYLNNEARKLAKGNYLLFLNNDIEFQSEDVLQTMLDPFAYKKTSAVGAKLIYPEKAIQHQGVVIVKGERRTVLEPGKHLKIQSVIEELTPLCVQEEFSAASGACLLVRSQDFDAIGGFDEKLAVVFNDVDLCLRLRENGGTIVVTPFVDIIHHESISRGKDEYGMALARHQRESGYLRLKHQKVFNEGDSLVSQKLNPHSTRYQPRIETQKSKGLVKESIIYQWQKKGMKINKDKPILLFAHYSKEWKIRPDILYLLNEYSEFCNIIFISASPQILVDLRSISLLKKICSAIVVRRNKGYDFGSWKTGISQYHKEINESKYLILSNDSFYGPIIPLDDLFKRIESNNSDLIGLTDNLMYEPHLSSAFTVFSKDIIKSDIFIKFWKELKIWPQKRDLVKNCEVGLSAKLRLAGYKINSLYTQNANGNVLHYDWKNLILSKNFPL